MPKLKTLSGKRVIKIFLSFGFEVAAQKGSHIKLKRVFNDSAKQTLTIPNRGTIKAIYRQSLKYIPESELKPYFYSE